MDNPRARFLVEAFSRPWTQPEAVFLAASGSSFKRCAAVSESELALSSHPAGHAFEEATMQGEAPSGAGHAACTAPGDVFSPRPGHSVWPLEPSARGAAAEAHTPLVAAAHLPRL